MDSDIVIIGAGVIGLAIASKVAEKDRDVFLLEQHSTFGQETSSRNSEVIHAGIYYPQNSLKARLCVEGAAKLYSLCEKHGIPHQRIGKLIIATTDDEAAALDKVKAQGDTNGVMGLELIGREEINKIEPNIQAIAALRSPNTGIVDTHKLMKHYESKARTKGVEIVYGCRVTGIEKTSDGYTFSATDSQGSVKISARAAINSAGLQADRIASMAGINIQEHAYVQHPCKGEYFGIAPAKSSLINGLVYPSPESKLTGLGIHVTKDLGGRLKLGPNAFYVDQINYDVDATHLDTFYESAKTFLPFLEKEDLFPDMSGIRPKLQGPKDDVCDFVINHEEDKGLPGFINLLGMESPGLTASIAIAEHVSSMMENYF